MNDILSKEEKRKLSQQKYRENHREEMNKKARERARKKRAENPEECNRLQRERRAKKPEHYRKAANDYYQRNKKHRQWLAREHKKKLRKKVIEGYGGKCKCCGETQNEFLALDHINGGGTKERKRVHAHTLYSFVIRNNFPPEYRILCHNCNASLGHYGYCPHNLPKQE